MGHADGDKKTRMGIVTRKPAFAQPKIHTLSPLSIFPIPI